MIEQTGEDDGHHFSYLPNVQRELKQMSCWITYTNPTTHAILRRGLPDSPLYNGQIQSIGPRYCPSIETKIVTFADKDAHQLFLEPEGVDSFEYYVNGFSSSLPLAIQLAALQSVKGLEHVVMYRPGYAIEYEESEATGYEGSVTRLETFGSEKVVMSRTGSVTSNMVVQLGEKHHCIYGTLYGNFEVGVEAQKIETDLDENGGRLFFSYVVDVNSSYVGVFEIEVEVKLR